ncbi:MAG: hypothetical protein ACRDIY_22790 [Chloroflexota bacterium]
MIRDDLYVDLKLLRTREHEWEKKLELARWLADARPKPDSIRARVLPRLGDLLIRAGQALKAPYQPDDQGNCPFASRLDEALLMKTRGYFRGG